MAYQHYQGPICPVVDDDPQVMLYLWFHTQATPEQRAAAIEATTPKEEADNDRQIKIAE